ncbi:hypothetical protein [Agromyces subbeticus]|uniref:hypothetical protein n=1 Tax=Agromyces subbeticus TaxID=293890 RepID=UPI0003B3BB51|nr:hypothetical protein [Agromyces subbeticus]
MEQTIASRRRRVPTKTKGVVAAFAAASIVATGAFGAVLASTGSPAQAAPLAAGYDGADGLLGGVWLNGKIVYCVNPWGSEATSIPDGTPSAGYSSVGLSADNAAKLNFVVSTYGQQGDNVASAATELYSWTAVGQIVPYAQSTGYSGSDPRGAAEWFSVRAGGDANAVMAKYDEIIAAAAGVTAGSSNGGSFGDIRLNVDSTNNYVGTIDVSNVTPAGATGTITLTHGIFDATGTNTISGVGEGSLAIRGVPPEGEVEYKISAALAYTGGGSGYAGNVEHYPNSAQDAVGPGERSKVDFSDQVSDPAPRTTIFSPALTTEVGSKFYPNGEKPVDVVDFRAIADPSGRINEWLRSTKTGNYAPITAKGTYYYSETNPELAQGAIPDDAIVAGHAEVTTDAQGPTHSYEVTGDTAIEKAGYFTWVWEIEFADQIDSVKKFLPADYSFVDEYGQRAETSIIAPKVTTESKPLEALGFPAHDTAIVEGAVFDGATVGFEAFKQDIDPETGQLVGDPICTPDTLVFTSEQKEVTGPGKVDSDKVVFEEIGKYFWVEKLFYTDPDTGDQTVVHEGECGAENETTIIKQVIVKTKATPEVELGTPAKDTASIRGTLPDGAKLTFNAYKQNGAEPVCTPDTLVFDGTKQPVGVTPGVVDGVEYTGPSTVFNEIGTYYWVETLIDRDGKVVHEGECGAEGETTIVKPVAGNGNSGAAAQLKNTGVDGNVFVVAGAGLLALIAAGVALLIAKRRRASRQGE